VNTALVLRLINSIPSKIIEVSLLLLRLFFLQLNQQRLQRVVLEYLLRLQLSAALRALMLSIHTLRYAHLQKRDQSSILREWGIVYAYLAERVAAFGDEGLGKFAHADGAVVFFEDLVHADLDLLAHLPHQLRLLNHFYHIFFSQYL
jgi:hypothetical protein